MGNIELLQIGPFVGGQRKRNRLGRLLDVTDLCRAHDRRGGPCQQPCKGYFGHRYAAFVCQRSHAVYNDAVLFGGGVIFQLCVAVLPQTLGGFAGASGKPPARKRAVRRHSYVFLAAEPCHLPFFLPKDQVVVSLHRYELCKAFPFGKRVRLCKLIGEAVGNPDITDLARSDGIVQALHNVVKRRIVIPHMANVQIHIVHSEILEAFIQHSLHMPLSGNARFQLRIGPGQEFRRNHNIITLRKVPNRSAEILFACSALVGDRRIKEVDAQLQPFFDDCTGMRFIDRPAMLAVSRFSASHTTHTNTGYTQIGVPQFRILHKLTFPKNRMGPAAFLPCRDSRRRRHSRGPTV